MTKFKTTTKKALGMTMGMVLVLGMGLSLAQGGPPANRGTGAAATTATTTQISDQAKVAILDALTGPEGEYAAYAMYDAVIAKYGNVEPYVSIRRAEANHIAALQRLLDMYGVDYPKENPYVGKVSAPDSLEQAAKAWAEGEIANVEMYDRLLPLVADYPNITAVFENLRSASLNQHLPIFQAAAENGGTLTPAQMQDMMMKTGHFGNR